MFLPEYDKHDAIGLSELVQKGDVSPQDLLRAAIERIEARNPALNAVVLELFARAKERVDTLPEGPLKGIPFLLKDLKATLAGTPTSNSTLLSKDRKAEVSSVLVKRYEAAGLQIVGKTNTPEFGLGSHTLNPVFGPTRNPWDRGRSAGGSSGGAAAALAMRMLPMADGSDMMGSLRNPAGWNNVIGFRPSVGRVPNGASEGDLYLHQLSTNGPMARSIADLALLLDAMAGYDPAAPLSFGKRGVFAPGLASEAPEDWAKGLRIAWLGDWNGTWPMEDGVLETCEDALKVFESLGAEVTPFVPDFPWEKIWDSWTELRSWSVAAANLPDYADEARRTHLKPEAVWEIERGLAMSGLDVHRASVARSDWHRCLEGVFDRFDLVAAPSAQLWPFPVMDRWPAEIAGRKMDTYHRWMECVLPASLSGRPTVCMPAGFGKAGGPGAGLPMGLQLMGRTRGDMEVLRAAAAYETACPHMTARPADPV